MPSTVLLLCFRHKARFILPRDSSDRRKAEARRVSSNRWSAISFGSRSRPSGDDPSLGKKWCSGDRRAASVRYLHGAIGAGEEDEWVLDRGGAHAVDAAYDDPVIACRVLGDDLALERGEGVGEQRYAAVSEFPVQTANRSAPAGVARVATRSCRRRERSRRSVPHAASGPTEPVARRAERDEGRLERDGRERVHDHLAGSPSGAAVTNATPVANLPSPLRNERASAPARAWLGLRTPSQSVTFFAKRDVAEEP